LLSVFCFTMKVVGTTFATNAVVLGVRIVPWKCYIMMSPIILYLLALTFQWTPWRFETDSKILNFWQYYYHHRHHF
jgi:hypothetical protein